RRLHTSHAFHSAMMDPILGEFEQLASYVRLSPPKLPFVATLTGEWADGNVTQPQYWSAQLRSSVRFADGMAKLLAQDSPVGEDAIYLEVGPGNTLVTFAADIARTHDQRPTCVTTLPGPDSHRSDTEVMLDGLGQLWVKGVAIDWNRFHQTERRR